MEDPYITSFFFSPATPEEGNKKATDPYNTSLKLLNILQLETSAILQGIFNS